MSDGSLEGTFAAGLFPGAIIFDGTNIWITNQQSDEVTKLRASDGALLGTFAAGPGPVGIAFDGTNVWVSNYGLAGEGHTVTKLASNGVLLGTFPTGSAPRGIMFDGANIWVANHDDDTVTKLRASDGSFVGRARGTTRVLKTSPLLEPLFG